MGSRSGIAAGMATLALFTHSISGIARGGDHDHDHKHVKPTLATPHTFHQAGHPECVSAIARESYNRHYSGEYVGGGKAFGGHGRCANEGTWGWDYTPFRPMSSRLFLKWSHGRHYQGGTGAYATDGPKPIEHVTEAIHGHFGGGE